MFAVCCVPSDEAPPLFKNPTLKKKKKNGPLPYFEVKIAEVLSDRRWKTLQLFQKKGATDVQKQKKRGGGLRPNKGD